MIKDRLYDRLCEIRAINTHEHLWDEPYRLENPGDWTSLFFHYGSTALGTAGLQEKEKEELFSKDTEHLRKWEIFSRVFDQAQNTAYIKAVLIAIKDIYGIDEINSDSMQELTDKMNSLIKPGFHRWVLREKANIDYCMVNCFDCDGEGNRYPARTWGDTELLRPDLYADSLIFPSGRSLMEKATGADCSTFSGWLLAIDRYFDKYAPKCCSIKIALGYRGHLGFEPGVSKETAERLYNNYVKGLMGSYMELRPMIDYLFFYILDKAREYHLPLKFHTGIYAGINQMNIGAIRDNVSHLAELAITNPDCKFIAMHIAYPFQDELVMAIKQITNLFADMSWSWIVDTLAAAEFLRKALTAASVTKIMGFGGDYSLVENTYGHLVIARRGISTVLADMVDSGYFSFEEACFIGKCLLRGSAERLYHGLPVVLSEEF